MLPRFNYVPGQPSRSWRSKKSPQNIKDMSLVSKGWHGEGFYAVGAGFEGIDEIYEMVFHDAGDNRSNMTETILYNDPDMNSITEIAAAWKQVEDGKVWMSHPRSGSYGNHDEHHHMHFIVPPETAKMVQESDYQEGKGIYYFSIHWGGDSNHSTNVKSSVAKTIIDLETQNAQDASEGAVVTEFRN